MDILKNPKCAMLTADCPARQNRAGQSAVKKQNRPASLMSAPRRLATLLSLLLIAGTGFCAGEKTIRYSEFGAKGDGKTDDFDAIFNAHDAANKSGARVRADSGAVYYIGNQNKTVQIQTDTDWGRAKFIIDDSNVPVADRNRHIFNVSSKHPAGTTDAIKSLRKNQPKVALGLPTAVLVVVTDTSVKHYIRFGPNQDNGTPKTDVFVVSPTGDVDMRAPIIWDFDNITSATCYPIDEKPLIIRGGHFTTIANRAESKYNYYNRGIYIARSNTIIDGVTHAITGEGEHGAPYSGFFVVRNCANVTVRNCKLSGHKIYSTIGSAGRPVRMGSYDISVGTTANVTFENCRQLDDINDTNRWGIFGSNYSKNIVFDNVAFSRFDAHKGVANATIKKSVIGHQGMNLIGTGTFLVENTRVFGSSFINLRDDYGSTFEGEIVIRDCEYTPPGDAVIINGRYSGLHDFGYTCHMPRKITMSNFFINDINPPKNYKGPKIFANFNKANTGAEYVEKYPYVTTKEVVISGLTIESGKSLIVSENKHMFRNVRITMQ
jgi:hypothetical protein